MSNFWVTWHMKESTGLWAICKIHGHTSHPLRVRFKAASAGAKNHCGWKKQLRVRPHSLKIRGPYSVLQGDVYHHPESSQRFQPQLQKRQTSKKLVSEIHSYPFSSLFPCPSFSSHCSSSDANHLSCCAFCYRHSWFTDNRMNACLHSIRKSTSCRYTAQAGWQDFLELWGWRTMSLPSQNKTLEDKTGPLLMLQPVVTGLFQKDLGGGTFPFRTPAGFSTWHMVQYTVVWLVQSFWSCSTLHGKIIHHLCQQENKLSL